MPERAGHARQAAGAVVLVGRRSAVGLGDGDQAAAGVPGKLGAGATGVDLMDRAAGRVADDGGGRPERIADRGGMSGVVVPEAGRGSVTRRDRFGETIGAPLQAGFHPCRGDHPDRAGSIVIGEGGALALSGHDGGDVVAGVPLETDRCRPRPGHFDQVAALVIDEPDPPSGGIDDGHKMVRLVQQKRVVAPNGSIIAVVRKRESCS